MYDGIMYTYMYMYVYHRSAAIFPFCKFCVVVQNMCCYMFSMYAYI